MFVDPVQSRLVDVLVLLAFEKMAGYGWWQYTRVSLKRDSESGAATSSIYDMGPVGFADASADAPSGLVIKHKLHFYRHWDSFRHRLFW